MIFFCETPSNQIPFLKDVFSENIIAKAFRLEYRPAGRGCVLPSSTPATTKITAQPPLEGTSAPQLSKIDKIRGKGEIKKGSPSPSTVPVERLSEEETEPMEDKDPSLKTNTMELEPSLDYNPASLVPSTNIGNQALHDRIEILEGQVVKVINRCDQMERN
ncbi:hypothetical protein Ccrd_020926 [Cynara cardunculus var. scolymus]|uniref:Uncharacterized protein n=1 Tax=Cynara cardunculus var. scolymus TaxID=59895 RepID=A0A103Y1K4_CYNCS|nr:hypothetical protein Ccrd_020926 [Cynara cardunculus var. scolymus]